MVHVWRRISASHSAVTVWQGYAITRAARQSLDMYSCNIHRACAHVNTRAHRHMHTGMCTHAHGNVHTHTHTHTHGNVHTPTPTHLSTRTGTAHSAGASRISRLTKSAAKPLVAALGF